MKRWSWQWLAVAAGATAVLGSGGYAPAEWPWAAWVAWAPALWAAGRGDTSGVRWALGGVFVAWLVELHWLTRVTWFGWAALSAWCALWAWPALEWMRRRTGGGLAGCALGAAGLWIGGEWFRGWVGGGFPWNPVGVAAAGWGAVAQWAEWGGASGIGAAAVAVNASLAWAVRRRRRWGWRDVAFVEGLAAAVAAGAWWGAARETAVERSWAASGERVRMALVQPSIPQPEKWDAAKGEMILGRLGALSAEGLSADPDVVVWPEAAFPDEGEPSEDSLGLVARIARRAPVLSGFLGVDWRGADDYDIANSAMLFGEGAGALSDRYDKRHLVLFGETIPVLCWMPKRVQAWAGRFGVPLSLRAGRTSGRVALPGRAWTMAPLICFEDAVEGLARADALGGARMLVNLTNDAWFDDRVAPRQHMLNARLRAIETRLPLVRCANTGVTCVISPGGRIAEAFADATGNAAGQGVLVADVPVPVAAPATFHTRAGEWPGVAGGAFLTAVAAAWAWRRRRDGRSKIRIGM